jgi:tetratricopeptide (TPR) repeat protein
LSLLISIFSGALPEPIPHEHLHIVHDQVSLLDILAKYRDVQAILQSYPAEHQSGLLWKKRMGARLEDAECANKYNSAIELFTQIHTAKESSNSPRADILLAIDDYAWALMLKGRYFDAASECRKALVGRTAELGTTHIDTLSSFHNLAEILQRDGKFDEAFRYIQDAIRGREAVLGGDHPDTVHSRAVKSRIILAKATSLADFDEAETLLVTATHKLAASLGDLHPLVMNFKSDRALIVSPFCCLEESLLLLSLRSIH